MNEWNKLSMADRAAYIKLGIDNGITDLAIMREVYNKYAEGGYVRELNNHPVSFDEEGNLIDLVTGEKGIMMLPNFNVYGHKDVADFVLQRRLNNLINQSEINPFTGETRVIGLESTYPEFELLGFKDLASPILNSVKKGVTYSAAKLGNKLAQSKIIADIMDNTFDISNYQYNIPYTNYILFQDKPILGLPAPAKRKLLQTNVLESSGETIPLTRFTTSLMEDMIDKVNKWGARYKYSMIPKSAAKNPRFAEELILDRLTEHNTFVRGVRDDHRHRDAVNKLASELLGVENPDVFDRLKVMATSYAPETGSGRAGFTPKYKGLGTIYASNSLGTAKAYSSRNHLGEGFGAIAVVRRPIDFNAPLDTWLILADIPFKNRPASVIYSKYNLPFLNLTGKSLNTVAKEMKADLPISTTKTDIILRMNNKLGYTLAQNWVNNILLKNQLYPNRFKYASTYINPLSINLLVSARLALELYNSLDRFLVFNRDFVKKYGNIGVLNTSRLIDIPEFIEAFNKYAGRIYNKHYSNFLKLKILRDVEKQYKSVVRKGNTPTIDDYSKILELYNVSPNLTPRDDGLITSESLRTSSRGNPDAFQHFIFTGPENTLGLEFVKFLNPDSSLPITGLITRAHFGHSSAGLSRKSKAYGGPLTTYTNILKGNKFEEGGPKDTYFGLTTDDWKDVGLGLLPVVGTINDALTFWEEPSLINGMGLGVSVATDIATLFGIGAAAKGAKSLYRTYKAKETLSNARRIAAKQAASKYKLTRMDRVLNTATNKEVKSSMQSMLAKKQNAELARQKAELANALFWNYTKAEMKNNAKQIASPLKTDTGMNILLNWWNTNM